MPGKKAAPQAEGKKKSSGSGYLVVILIIVVLAIYGSCTGNGSSDPVDGGGQTSGHEAVEAHVVCQQFVEDRLRAPSTADFSGPYSRVTTHLGGGRYRVATYVDAQNSFGAMIRTNFICEMSHISGDRYSLESLVMDE